MATSSSSEGKLFVYLCLGMGLGIFGFFRGFKLRKKKKLIENIPTSTVRGMAGGLAEVKGVALEFKGTLKTPFAKADSVFYHYKIEEYRSSGRSGRWVTIKEFASSELFYLEDDTGKVLINPVGAELYLQADRNFRLGAWGKKEESDIFEERLKEIGIDPHAFLGFHKSLRCTETYLCAGDRVYVMGDAAKNSLVEASATGSENLCIQKGAAPFFCIADKSEKQLLGSMSGRMYLFLYGGPILTVICLFFLISCFFKQLL